jgi:hypothetical protein
VLHDPFDIPVKIFKRHVSMEPAFAMERILRHLGNGTAEDESHSGVSLALSSVSLVALAVAAVTMIGSFLSALVGFAFALTTSSLLSNLVGSRTAQVRSYLSFLFFFSNFVCYLCVWSLLPWLE